LQRQSCTTILSLLCKLRIVYDVYMHILIISSSLNKESRSRLLAEAAAEQFKALQLSCELLDIGEYEIPLCDGDRCFQHPLVSVINDKLERASAIILAMPIYNFALSAAAKNFVELTGERWRGKVVGLMAAAGGNRSYMGIMTMASSLMLDYHCLVVPEFVFAATSDFTEEERLSKTLPPDILERIMKLGATVASLAKCWNTVREELDMV